jgi:hypothetical protein
MKAQTSAQAMADQINHVAGSLVLCNLQKKHEGAYPVKAEASDHMLVSTAVVVDKQKFFDRVESRKTMLVMMGVDRTELDACESTKWLTEDRIVITTDVEKFNNALAKAGIN